MLAMPDRFVRQKKVEKMNKDQGRFGTNKSFMGKYDGQGQSTKSTTQMLSEKAPANVWQQIGVPEPAAAAKVQSAPHCVGPISVPVHLVCHMLGTSPDRPTP